MKNPLTPIQLSAEHLRRVYREDAAGFPAALDACTEAILRQVRTLRALVTEFTALARPPVEPLERIDVAELARGLARPYAVALPPGVSLLVAVDPAFVRGDRRLLERAVTGVRLFFATTDGSPRNTFRLHEPWQVRMEFHAFREVGQLVASMGLATYEGVPVTTIYSRSGDLAPGSYSVDFRIDIPLSPCELQFNVGLLSHRRILYYHEGVGHVSIVPAAAGEQPFSLPSGVVTTQCRPELRSSTEGNPTDLEGTDSELGG